MLCPHLILYSTLKHNFPNISKITTSTSHSTIFVFIRAHFELSLCYCLYCLYSQQFQWLSGLRYCVDMYFYIPPYSDALSLTKKNKRKKWQKYENNEIIQFLQRNIGSVWDAYVIVQRQFCSKVNINRKIFAEIRKL